MLYIERHTKVYASLFVYGSGFPDYDIYLFEYFLMRYSADSEIKIKKS
jgi:hypothetical protein